LWLNCRERLLSSPGVPLDTRIRTFAVVSYSEVAQNFALRAGDFGWEGLGGAVERDRRVAQWSEFFDDLATESPVRDWMQWETAKAANTMLGCASMASR
jgi:hypothetical protein